ncbi:MAG: biopolymer transporter ExbD [Chitinivibrionales bacterium]|nr:biopolymer transporter ExbD [Chitinivibrionales bacterium]MBD3394929.1 biopolymer transporter ExbD [Chitinivibrionales bacterium]
MFDESGLLNRASEAAEVDMAPLIDMVFILLIFFVVTTNFSRQTGVDVSKPKAKSAMSQGQKTIMIGVTREGTIHMHGRQVTPERLHMLVDQEVTKHPETSVVIIADEDAAIGKAVLVMDQCALAGAKKVSLAAEKE